VSASEAASAPVLPWPRFMTARVAAQYAHTSPWTIRRNVAPCGRRGRSFVYSLDEIDRWMQGTPTTAPAAVSGDARRRCAPTPAATSIEQIRALAKYGGAGVAAPPEDVAG
jgi:hypothetical protein